MVRDRLEQRVYTYINKHAMVKPGDRVLLAVSGGPDSLALLHIMHQLAAALEIEVQVAHLDHALREGSDREARLVEATCGSLGIPFYGKRVDVGEFCRRTGQGIEAGARQVRHQWLREEAARVGASRIATAHHRDDQVETVLLHLIRGSGLKGLIGMEPVSGMYMRPFLFVGKAELIAYLEKRGIDYCVDQSNYDTTYLRNRVRHELLPRLEADYNPAIRERLFMLAEVARGENDFLTMSADRAYQQMARAEEDGSISLDLTQLGTLHPALRSRVLITALTRIRGNQDFTSRDIEAISRLTASPGSARSLRLGGNVEIQKEYDRLYLRTRSSEMKRLASWQYELPVPGEVEVAELGLMIKAHLKKPGVEDEGDMIVLDRQACPPLLEVRTRRRGDRILLPGGTRKLSDWFVDHKVPHRERDQILLLARGGEVIWIRGGPVGLPYRATTSRSRVWITIHPLAK